MVSCETDNEMVSCETDNDMVSCETDNKMVSCEMVDGETDNLLNLTYLITQ